MESVDRGYVKFYRSAEGSWQWRRPKWWKAWSWLMIRAAWKDDPKKGVKRGQVLLSLRSVAKEWGMSKSEAHRFLSIAKQESDILWEKSSGWSRKNLCPAGTENGTENGTDKGTERGTEMSRITLLNYDLYNPPCEKNGTKNGTENGTESLCPAGTVLKEEEKNLKKKGEALAFARAGAVETAPTKTAARKRLSVDDQFACFDRNWAARETPDVNVELEISTARDWLRSRGVVKKDYHAFIRNWLRKAQQSCGFGSGSSAPVDPDYS